MKKIVKSLLFVAIVASMSMVGSCGNPVDSSSIEIIDTATYDKIKCKSIWVESIGSMSGIPYHNFFKYTTIIGDTSINPMYRIIRIDTLDLYINRYNQNKFFHTVWISDGTIYVNLSQFNDSTNKLLRYEIK